MHPDFRAYFDESGHPDDPNTRAFAVGGCIASSEDWNAFDRTWSAALEAAEVPWFHMRDFAHSRGVFEGWPEKRRRALLATLIRTMKDHRLGFIGTAWRFDRQDSRHALDHYYTAAYRTCILYAQPFAVGGTVDFVFAQQSEISAVLYEAYHERVRRADRETTHLGSLRFDDPRRLTPLQAADLIAYEVRHNAGRLSPIRWPLQQLPRKRCRFELLSP
jgi:hypothetical protein